MSFTSKSSETTSIHFNELYILCTSNLFNFRTYVTTTHGVVQSQNEVILWQKPFQIVKAHFFTLFRFQGLLVQIRFFIKYVSFDTFQNTIL